VGRRVGGTARKLTLTRFLGRFTDPENLNSKLVIKRFFFTAFVVHGTGHYIPFFLRPSHMNTLLPVPVIRGPVQLNFIKPMPMQIFYATVQGYSGTGVI
jgi:hypothetical protein